MGGSRLDPRLPDRAQRLARAIADAFFMRNILREGYLYHAHKPLSPQRACLDDVALFGLAKTSL
jgi:hypothetical protein